MRQHDKRAITADKALHRVSSRLRKRLHRSALLHAKDALQLKPALSSHWHQRLDELDSQLGFA